MSGGRRALTSWVGLVARQALQKSSTSLLLPSPAYQGTGSAFLQSLRSPQLGVFCNHLATASLPAAAAGTRKVSMMTNLKQLSKFRLSSLVVLTASAGFVMGSGDTLDWGGLVWTSLGTFGAAACANTLNQIYEVANDSRMNRTCNRPLPAGRMTRLQALAFAMAAGSFGLGTLYYQTNGLTTALGAANIALYAGVYTPLKQISILNTWMGAVVGAIPPLMGWASAAGQLDMGAYVLAGALFFWQLPHFLALAWLCKDDYIRGGFRMISAMDRSGKRTAAAALRNSVYLLPLGLFAYCADVTTQPFAWEAAALAGMLLLPAARFWQQPSQQAARKLFRASLLYLPLAMAGMAIHRQPHTQHSGITLGEMQAALWRHLEGPPHSGVLPLMRSSMEQSAAAASRVLGFSHTVIRCPSMVHSDDGGNRRIAGHRIGTAQQPALEAISGEEQGGTPQAEVMTVYTGPAAVLESKQERAGVEKECWDEVPATPAVVVVRRAARAVEERAAGAWRQRERREVWVTPALRGGPQAGTWREGLDL